MTEKTVDSHDLQKKAMSENNQGFWHIGGRDGSRYSFARGNDENNVIVHKVLSYF